MADAYKDDDMEDLEANAAVMLMANMQELHFNETGPVYDTDGLSQVHATSLCLDNDIASSSLSAFDTEHDVQPESSLPPLEDDQINTYVAFDDPIEVVNHDPIEQHDSVSDPDSDPISLFTQRLNDCATINQKLNAKIALLTSDLERAHVQISSEVQQCSCSHFQNCTLVHFDFHNYQSNCQSPLVFQMNDSALQHVHCSQQLDFLCLKMF